MGRVVFECTNFAKGWLDPFKTGQIIYLGVLFGLQIQGKYDPTIIFCINLSVHLPKSPFEFNFGKLNISVIYFPLHGLKGQQSLLILVQEKQSPAAHFARWYAQLEVC